MSYYRDVYLKSDDWKNLRAAVIATKAPDGKCWICERVKPLDVHHIEYKNLWDVHPKSLRPLCRGCHDAVHKLLASHPEWRVYSPRQRWSMVVKLLRPLWPQTKIQKRLTQLKRLIASLKKQLEKAESELVSCALLCD